MKSCCALRLAIRRFKGEAGARFTCAKCGQSFLRREWRWEPIRTVEDILDMMATEHARQQQVQE